jgi:hypothetical protein
VSSRLSSVSRFSHGEYQDQPPRYERVESYPSLEKNGVEAPPLSIYRALYQSRQGLDYAQRGHALNIRQRQLGSHTGTALRTHFGRVRRLNPYPGLNTLSSHPYNRPVRKRNTSSCHPGRKSKPYRARRADRILVRVGTPHHPRHPRTPVPVGRADHISVRLRRTHPPRTPVHHRSG